MGNNNCVEDDREERPPREEDDGLFPEEKGRDGQRSNAMGPAEATNTSLDHPRTSGDDKEDRIPREVDGPLCGVEQVSEANSPNECLEQNGDVIGEDPPDPPEDDDDDGDVFIPEEGEEEDDEDDPLAAINQLGQTRSQRLPERKVIAQSTRPKIQADTLRQLFYSLDRSPFLDILAYAVGCSPDPEAMIEFADKSPLHWANMISVFAKLGGYTEKTESVNTNILVEMGKLSDVQLMQEMRRLDNEVRPMIEQIPTAEGGKNNDKITVNKE